MDQRIDTKGALSEQGGDREKRNKRRKVWLLLDVGGFFFFDIFLKVESWEKAESLEKEE